MHVVITGGKGFLGGRLSRSLVGDRHSVTVLTRSLPDGATRRTAVAGGHITEMGWTPDGSVGKWAAALEGAEAAVNLTGESIAAGRWTAARKARILESRRRATASLVAAIGSALRKPRVLVSSSAVGYYGPRGDETITEDSPAGDDFLAQVCREWEAAARRVTTYGTRVVLVRTGIVLARDGGALPKMLLPFKLFAGGPIGSGRQYMPWIHVEDWTRLVRWAIETDQAEGAFNGTAPNPVTNAEFSPILARALHRPSWFPTPGFALRLVLGEMAGALLLSGQRAVPAHATRLGFAFLYPDLESALSSLFQ